MAAQRCHRLNSGGSASWEVAAEQSNAQQKRSHRCVSDWVPGRSSEEQGGNQVGSPKGSKGTGGEAHDGKSQGLKQNRSLNTAAGRSEGHAHAYLLCPLCYGIGDNSVDAQRGKERAETSENSHE